MFVNLSMRTAASIASTVHVAAAPQCAASSRFGEVQLHRGGVRLLGLAHLAQVVPAVPPHSQCTTVSRLLRCNALEAAAPQYTAAVAASANEITVRCA